MNKLKVAWICHFSNRDIRQKLPLSKMRFINFIKRIFGKQNKSTYTDFAPWITNQILEFEKNQDVELHVIAPHTGLKNLTWEFELNNVYYHFFKADSFFLIDAIIDKLFKPKKRKYWLNRLFVKQFLNNINPDIVNLIGAENPYYSITALDINHIPVYVSLQTILSTPYRDKYKFVVDAERIELENRIITKSLYFATGARMYRDCVMNINSKALILSSNFPRQRPPIIEIQPIEFDFVFFAGGVSEIKGIEDTIEAFSLVKKTEKYSNMNVVGFCNTNYKKHLKEKITTLGLDDSIFFNDYFPLHSDMFKQVKKSKIAVIPNKLDVISSTIIEAMFLEIPIVSYKTTGTPFLNREKETILLSEIGDVNGLANNMLRVLHSPELSRTLVHNAKYIAEKEFNNAEIAKKLVADYKAIVNHYNSRIPIPENLLFNIDVHPIY